MTTSLPDETPPFLSRLKFRAVQPVDIPRCYQLECTAYPLETGASKSTLQNIQHHAAPFFRCVLLKKSKSDEGRENDKGEVKLDEGESEACHHVHHSPNNELIGYVCGTRCHDVAPTTEFKSSPSVDADQPPLTSSEKSQPPPYPYPLKHEASGRFLAIHSIVVQKEYQKLGVAKALLEYYIKSVEIYNAELDEAGINRRRNKLKARKRDTKIEKIILLSKSSMVNLFLPAGFQWRATVKIGGDPLYEMERGVESSPSSHTSVSSTDLQPHPLMGQDCFLVDAFANPEFGRGNPAAVVVLQSSPAKLISDYYNNVVNEKMLQRSMSNGSKVQDEEELAKRQAEAWLHSVAKEFNQPATAFIWPIGTGSIDISLGKDSSSTISDDELNLSQHEGSSNGQETQSELHYFIRFYTSAGVEINTCSHATLAAASVLFRQYGKENTLLSFHSRKDVVIQASNVSPPVLIESNQCPPSSSPQALPPVKSPPRLMTQASTAGMEFDGVSVAIDYPWRSVEPVPPGPEGQGAVLAMLRRAFFRAWSVVAPDEKDNDTDGLAFSLSMHHVAYMGVTEDREDLLVELSVEGFDMLTGRSVDYDSLRQGWNGFTEGVIICCVPESLDENDTSGVILDTHAEINGDGVRKETSGDFSIDFCSKYFQPKLRNEDPASGWPHCALGPYFARRLGKQRVMGLQSSERGGLVECVLKENEQKVCIIGAAVTTLAGKTLMRV